MPDQPTQIQASDYLPFLDALKHVYVVGDLQQPVPHPFIRDDRLELVIVAYPAGTVHQRHWHAELTEYMVVIAGELRAVMIPSGEELIIQAGDMLHVPPETCLQLTTIDDANLMVVKVPSVNDKITCNRCQRDCEWRLDESHED